MALQKKTVIAALAIASIMMIASVLALLTSTKTIPSSGTINAFKVGVYTDAGFLNPITTITWAALNPGESTSQTVYVRNEAGSLSVKLSLSNSSWTPSNANEYLNITWDQQGTILAPTNSVPAILTLAAHTNATDGLIFSVNVLITGTQQ